MTKKEREGKGEKARGREKAGKEREERRLGQRKEKEGRRGGERERERTRRKGRRRKEGEGRALLLSPAQKRFLCSLRLKSNPCHSSF